MNNVEGPACRTVPAGSVGRSGPIIGWQEWILLPQLCTVPIKAKIDTGAQTSTLHAFNLEVSTDGPGAQTASFELHPVQHSDEQSTLVSAPVVGFRTVRSSNGMADTRPVIRAEIEVGGQIWRIDLTLTSRDEMDFRMLLGRSAVKRRFLVDPARSFVQGEFA